MNQIKSLEPKCIKLFAVVWLFALLALAQSSRAKDHLTPDFPHDLGLSPAFISAHISRLQASSGPSHYRMRYYQFDIDELANQKISGLFAKHRVQSLTMSHPTSRMINTLVSNGRPNAKYNWTWTDMLPPYQQQFFACYPGNAPDYGFRWLEIQPSRSGKRKALLAAGNRVPALSASALSDCDGVMKGTQLAEFYSPILTKAPLPYPFARRSFREMLRTQFEPKSLNYFGFIFVDAKHWFRFSASKLEFEKIMRGLAMQPKPNQQELYLDDTTQPEWWRITARDIQWIHCARFPVQTAKPGEAVIEYQRLPLHIYAAWQDGFGYVVMPSGASSKSATDSCE